MKLLPKISIVTPSFNQGKYIEKTILSVLEQGYPNLEYIIIDGGSTDESVEIIKKYADRLTYWESEPDRGQSHAINKGFERATGEIFGWLNSDDWYHPGALQAVAEVFAANLEAGAVVGAGEMVDEEGMVLSHAMPGEVTLDTLYSWFDKYFWQPSCFFTRDAWKHCGPLDEQLHLAMDLDLWIKIAKKYPFVTTDALLSITLKHPDAKTTAQSHLSDIAAMKLIIRHGGEDAAIKIIDSYTSRLLQFDLYSKQQLAELKATMDVMLAERDRQLTEKERTISDLDQQNKALIASLSWKITAPLRAILDKVKASAGWVQTFCLRDRVPDESLRSINTEFAQKLAIYYETTQVIKLIFPKVSEPSVSILIPVHNQWNHTYSCLYSIYENTQGIAYEIIIADDLSSDETKNISAHVENVVALKNAENLGFLHNCNNAAKYAKGKYILFLNNDTNVQKDWLRHLLSVVENDNTIGLVGSMLVYPDGRLQEAGGIIWNDASGQNFGRMDDPDKPEYNYQKEVDFVSGASMLIRRDLWEEIGGFDGRFAPAYYEDTDLAFTVRSKGYRVVYQPKSVVVHFEGISHGTDLSIGTKSYQLRNKHIFYEKWKNILAQEHGISDKDVFWARDRSKNKKTIVFFDYEVPHFDMFAGSRTNYMYLKLLVKMGLNVKFIGADFKKTEPYTYELNKLGIETLDGEWYKNNWQKWILHNSEFIDYVFFNRPDPTKIFIDFVKKHTRALILYQVCDLHYLRLQRKFEIDHNVESMEQAKYYEKLEYDLINKSDVTFTYSEIEAQFISKMVPRKKVLTVPLYFYEKFDPEELDCCKRKDLMFIGGHDHKPNVDAVLWFSKDILPKILKKLPDVVFYVVGSNPPEEIRALSSVNIKIMGHLSDDELDALYERIRLNVIPLRYGAGVKGKTTESIYKGIPLVSTSIGIEGMPDIHEIIHPKDTEDDFADEVVWLYSDAEKWNNFSERSKAYIKNHFSLEKTEAIMREVLSNC